MDVVNAEQVRAFFATKLFLSSKKKKEKKAEKYNVSMDNLDFSFFYRLV
jgi:hypothetical protein